jgi:hypothetical protein
MSAALVRLALLQFVTLVLSVLFAGVALKAHYGSGSHLPLLATYVRDYGVILLLVPFAWAVWGALETNRPRAGAGDAAPVFATGVVLYVGIAYLAVSTYTSALCGFVNPESPKPVPAKVQPVSRETL